LGAILALIFWQAARTREPAYQGKSLSQWLQGYHLSAVGGPEDEIEHAQRETDEAVRHIGTKAVPTLLRMLRAKDSDFKVKAMDLLSKQRLVRIEWTSAWELNYWASLAFQALGDSARPYVPVLVEIAEENISTNSRYCAIDSLTGLGPTAEAAVPALLRWTTNADRHVRFGAINALGAIHAEPEKVVPVLTNALADPDPFVKRIAMKAMRDYGTNAKAAAPALLGLLNDPRSGQSRGSLGSGESFRSRFQGSSSYSLLLRSFRRSRESRPQSALHLSIVIT
jgi:hypothetical protein